VITLACATAMCDWTRSRISRCTVSFPFFEKIFSSARTTVPCVLSTIRSGSASMTTSASTPLTVRRLSASVTISNSR
jgi:hypothetical protein